MERELWIALYKLARDVDPAPWWAVTTFFRLGDRERLFVGSGSRSTDPLGLRGGQLA